MLHNSSSWSTLCTTFQEALLSMFLQGFKENISEVDMLEPQTWEEALTKAKEVEAKFATTYQPSFKKYFMACNKEGKRTIGPFRG